MNKRIKKKKFKQFQKQFCEPPFYEEKGYAEWQCKRCGNMAAFVIMNLRLNINVQFVEVYSVMLMGLDLHRY